MKTVGVQQYEMDELLSRKMITVKKPVGQPLSKRLPYLDIGHDEIVRVEVIGRSEVRPVFARASVGPARVEEPGPRATAWQKKQYRSRRDDARHGRTDLISDRVVDITLWLQKEPSKA